MKKRILFFNVGSCGGAERTTVLYAKILQKAGFNCKMYIHILPGYSVDISKFIPDNLEYEIIETRHRYMLFHLIKIVLTDKCDFVFSSMPLLVKFLIIVRWITFGKFKIVARCFNMPSKMPNKTRTIIKWFRYADIIISQTGEMKNELISFMQLSSNKVLTILNPIDKELIKEKIKEKFNLDSNYVNFTATGRISRQKDYITMIVAFREVVNTISNSRLYILGEIEDFDYFALLESRIEELGLKNNVFYERFQINPYKYIYHSDVFLLSSVYEGLPNALLEAMYLNKPVVATRSIPFIQQVIENGVNGYSVDVKDCQAFAVNMLKAIKLKEIDNNTIFSNDSEKIIIKLFSE